MNTTTAAAPLPPFFAAVLLLLPLVLIAFITPLTVRSRRGIVFGVTLPLEFADSVVVREAIARFRRNNTRIAAIAIMLVVWLHAEHYVNAAASASIVGTFALLIGGLVLRAREAARLKPHAIVVPLTRTASLTATSSGNGALVASLLAFLPLLATAFWLRAHWNAIPARWPQHWNAAGQVNGWGTRTAGHVYEPLAIGATVIFVCAGIVAFMVFAPGTDGTMRRRFNAPLAVISWLFAGLFSFIALTPLHNPGSPIAIATAVVVHMVATLGVVIWMIRRSGLVGGGMQAAALAEAPAYDGTPDSAWHLGLFYFNRSDPAVLVPKRFGFGWTLNFGRPIAWVFMVLVFGLMIGSLALKNLFK